MKLEKRSEGKITFWSAPLLSRYAFYNPAAELQRDISICVAQAWQKVSKQKLKICDALSGVGVRGLRYAKEVSGVNEVVLNDKNPFAVKVIKRNIALNKLQKICRPSCADANILLRENVFNFIDIDPFGSPNIFLDSTARSIWHRGFVAITATDTAPLSGSAPTACFRKYAIRTFKGAPFYSELGLRTLLSFIVLTMARYDRAFIPMLSHSTMHYFRCYGKIEHAGAIDGLLKKFGFVSYNSKTGEFKLGKQPVENWQFSGPLYLGQIQNKKFVKEVLKDLTSRDFNQKHIEGKLLNMLIDEAEAPPFYFNLHTLASTLKACVRSVEDVLLELREKGFFATRTHLCPTAIKTDADFRELKTLLV